MLKLFKLTPHPDQLDHPSWADSKYKGEARIVAQNEDDARAWALVLAGAHDIIPSNTLPDNPWDKPEVVTCIEIDDPDVNKDTSRIIKPINF